MSNGKPDPNCPECGGTGIITLLRFNVPCECVETEESSDPYTSNDWKTNNVES